MNLSRSLTAIVLAAVFIQTSRQDCLSAVNLALTGFNLNVTNTTGVCTDLFANSGACVDATQMRNSFNLTKAYLSAGVNLTLGVSGVLNALANSIAAANNLTANITGAANSIANSVLSSVGSIASSTSVSSATNAATNAANKISSSISSAFGFGLEANPAADTSASANVGVSLGSSTIANAFNTVLGNTTSTLNSTLNTVIAGANGTLNTIAAGANATINANTAAASASVTTLNTIATNAKAALNTCYQNYENLVNGMYCYLASNQATTYTQTMTSGSTLYTIVNVDVNSTGAALATCMPVIDAYCTTTFGVSITTNLTSALLSSMTLLTADSSNMVTRETCQTLKANYGCSTATCTQTTYLTLINNVFSASTVKFLQTASFLTATNATIAMSANATASINSITSTIGNLFGVRALQTSTSSHQVEMVGNSNNGQNVNQNGQSSGANKTTYYQYTASARALFVFATLLFATLYA